jgi:YVTN family beta-propeller protein
MSCGGGGGDDSAPGATSGSGSPAAPGSVTGSNGMEQPTSFVPPNPIPSDANVRGMWSPVYAWPVIAVHSVLLPDGRVMTYGSDLTGAQTGHANYDIWDSTGAPDQGHLNLPNTSGTDIFCSSQVLLPQSGNVFVAGGDVWTGTQTNNLANNNSNLFDTANSTVSRGPNMFRPRWYSSSVTLVSGETYIQGGSGGGGDRPEIRGTDGTFRLMSGINTSTLGAKYPRVFVAPSGGLFGYDPDSGQMYTVDTTGTGTITMLSKFNAAYSGAWFSSTAMYRPGHILQLGGNSNGAYTIDITGATPVVTPTQSMSATRAWLNATILADGKVLATSGSAVPNDLTHPDNIAEIWDPATGQWTQGAVAAVTRMYHSNALMLPDGSVLVSGGGASQPLTIDPKRNNLSAEIYYPPYLFTANGTRATRPTVSNAPGMVDIGDTFSVDVSGAASVSRVTLVKTGSTTHSFNMDQRFLDLTYVANGLHISVQAPTHAAEATPGYYLLFVFNEAGVPSVGKILRIGIATDPNPAIKPVITNPGSQTNTVGSAVNLALSASDPNGDALSYSATGLPNGLSMNATTGHITGTVTTQGNFNVVVAASDGINSATTSFAWTVQAPQPLTLNPPPNPPFVTVSGTATYTASALGGTNLRYKWNFGDGTSDTAWSASPSITHTYANPGTYVVTITVTDDSQAVRSSSFTQAVYLPATANQPTVSSNVIVETPASGNPRLWVVNQDNDSVSVFDTVTLSKLAEIAVGSAPRSIALAPNGTVWVSNKRGATISVIDTTLRKVTRTLALPRGSQPFGIAMSPTGTTAYVALEAGGQLLRFDTGSYAQTGNVSIGLNARQVSVSADGTVYVSRFITPPLPGESTATVAPTASTGGEVLQISGSTLGIVRTIVLQHSDTPDGENQGRGIPNFLGAATISPDGSQAWVPSKQDNIKRGALRDGTGLNFQNTVRAISSRINLSTQQEDLSARIDHDNSSVATAAVYEPRGVYLFVALETSREVAVLNAFSGAQLFRIDVGRAPQGLAMSADGRTLYVNNFMDRTVSVLSLASLIDQNVFDLPTIATLSAVGTEKLTATVLQGKRLFYDARDTRLARDSYMSCATCHNDGGHDGRVWDMTSLGEGLRNTIALRGRAGMGQGFLHWSNNFDEVQDFEGQIRALEGGTGLMADTDFNAGTRSSPLGDRKTGLSADLDALAAYVTSLNAFDPAPARPSATSLSSDAAAGKTVFDSMNCASCHAGRSFTGSGANTLVNIGTIKPSSGSRLGGPLTGIDVPTLRDVWATAPYLHDGSAPTLEAAVRAHNGVVIDDASLANLVAYLKEIGSDEPPATEAPGNGTGMSGTYFNNISLSGDPALQRIEAVDFDWGTGSPGPGIGVDNFSARWMGTLTVPSTGTYQFQTSSDDGIAVWVNGIRAIYNWTDHLVSTNSSNTMNLVAGQSVPVQVEYYDHTGPAVARLRWLTPGNPTYVAIPASRLIPTVTPGLTGNYYTTINLTGAPAVTRIEAVDFDWGAGSPAAGIPSDNFSVRWTGTLVAGSAGTYRFQTVTDDGVRLFINGTQIISNWSDHTTATTNTTGDVTLTAGQRVPIRMDFYDKTGNAVARLRWLPPGASSYVAIPAASLLPN